MATTRLMPLHTGKGRTVGTAIEAIIDYVANPEKTDSGRLITSWQCDSRVADREFLFSKQQYIRNTGRVRGADNVIAYHLRQSFRPGEITPEEANRLGCELARRFTKGNHAYIVCTHIDKAHIHNHVIWNSTALDGQSKFRNFWGSTKAIRRLSDTICIENGYSIVENPKGKGKSYDKWLGEQKKPSHREHICYAIDEALAQKLQSFEKLLEQLQLSGYQVKGGKVPALLGEGQKRFIRMDTLGAGYTPDDLRAIIAGTKAHTLKKKRVMDAPAKPSGSLLIDIQAKLQEGKGAGYARWAKNFNLKQLCLSIGTIPLFGAGVFLKEGDFSIYRPTDQRQSVEAGWSFPGNLALKVPANYGGIFGIQKFLDVPAQNLTAPVPVPEPAGNHLPPVILRPPALNVCGVLCEEIGKLCFPAVQPKGKPFPNGVFSLLHSASPFRKSPISPARISCPKSLGCRPSVVSFAAISGSFARITLVSNKSSRGRP